MGHKRIRSGRFHVWMTAEGQQDVEWLAKFWNTSRSRAIREAVRIAAEQAVKAPKATRARAR